MLDVIVRTRFSSAQCVTVSPSSGGERGFGGLQFQERPSWKKGDNTAKQESKGAIPNPITEKEP